MNLTGPLGAGAWDEEVSDFLVVHLVELAAVMGALLPGVLPLDLEELLDEPRQKTSVLPAHARA